MAHRGEAPARTWPDAAATARRSEEAEAASLRLLIELEQRHRSMLQALVAQQASIPASPVSPVMNPALMRSPRPGNGAAFGAFPFPSATRSNPTRPTAPAASSHERQLPTTPGGFAVFRSRNASVPVSSYDARVHGVLHVARELDVDAQGRTLVGVESGPHKELRVALDRMRAAPRYGALGMADELILLTADAVVFRDDALAVKAPDGAPRFLILNESYQRAVAAYGSWVVDGDVVEDVLADVVDEAAKARSAPEAERKALLAGFKKPGAELREDARTRTKNPKDPKDPKDPKPFSSSRGRKRTREEGDERTAASPGLGFPEPKPLLESRPAVDATGDAERKEKGAERIGAAPLPVAATASSGSESSEGSETSASGESDSQTASGGEGDRASRSKRRREAVERAVAAAQRARLKEKAKDDAKDDFDDDSEVPFIDVDIVAPGGAVARALDTLPAAASRRKREPPRLEEFHAIRGLVRGSAADSLASPIRKPPPSSTVQFQLATPGNPFHVLAVRCDARSDEGDFDVRVGAGGLVYVDKKASADGEKGSTDVFEFVARFPEPVDEASAQCVVKDGVLFVICEPSSE
jgi:hypothetical protein